MAEHGNSRNFYGTIISLNRKFRCYVSFDKMPEEHKKIHVKIRNTLSFEEDLDEEEQEHDHIVEECEKIGEKKCNIQLKLQQEFSISSNDEICSAKNSFMKWNGDKHWEKELEWDTIEDTNSIELEGGDFDADVERRKDIELDPNNENLSELHFKNFFLCAKGNAKFIDEHHSSRISPHYSLVNKKISSHDLQHKDSNYLLKNTT